MATWPQNDDKKFPISNWPLCRSGHGHSDSEISNWQVNVKKNVRAE